MTPVAAALATLEAFGVEAIAPPVRLTRGTLNQNFRVETAAGRCFLRRHRSPVNRPWVEREHRMIGLAAAAGVPAPLPRATPGGETVVEADGACWSLFPWIEGRQIVRGRASRSDAFALGELLGRLHAGFAGEAIAVNTAAIRWDTAASAETLQQVMAIATERHADNAIIDGLAYRLRLLESGAVRDPSELADLPVQLCHGDYHDRQVIFAHGASQAVALVDWEMVSPRPRVWELIRALFFARLESPSRLAAFAAGYGRHVALSQEEAATGLELWWQSRLHETWAFTAYFVEGNRRVGVFLGPSFAHLRELADPAYRASVAAALASPASR